MEDFFKLLERKVRLRKVILNSKRYGSVERFARYDASDFQLGLSLRKGSYLSHESAAFLHGLRKEYPAKIYINKEQTPK